MPPIAVGRVENQNEPKRFGFQLDSLEKHLITLKVFTYSRSYRDSEHKPAFSNLPFWKFVHFRGSYLYTIFINEIKQFYFFLPVLTYLCSLEIENLN